MNHFLTQLPIIIATFSKAILKAIKEQILEVAIAFQEAIRSLWFIYHDIESAILGTIVDVYFSILALRYFLALVAVGAIFLYFHWWWVFIIYATVIIIAVIRFFSMPALTGGDINDHLQNKAGVVSFLRWPLRISFSLIMFYLTWHFGFFGKIIYSHKADETQKHVVQERHQMDEISRRAEEEQAKERTRIAETEKRLAEKSRQANESRRKNEEEQLNISRSPISTAQVTSVNQPLIKVGDIYIYESVDSDHPESSVTTKRTVISNRH